MSKIAQTHSGTVPSFIVFADGWVERAFIREIREYQIPNDESEDVRVLFATVAEVRITRLWEDDNTARFAECFRMNSDESILQEEIGRLQFLRREGGALVPCWVGYGIPIRRIFRIPQSIRVDLYVFTCIEQVYIRSDNYRHCYHAMFRKITRSRNGLH